METPSDTTGIKVGPLAITLVKPGTQTTEFRGKAVLQLMLLAIATFNTGVNISDDVAVLLIGFLEAAYAISRGIAKRGPSLPADSKELMAAITAALDAQAKKEETTP